MERLGKDARRSSTVCVVCAVGTGALGAHRRALHLRRLYHEEDTVDVVEGAGEPSDAHHHVVG